MKDFEKNVAIISDSMYDAGNQASIGGTAMSSTEILDAVLKKLNKTRANAAQGMGWTMQQLNCRIFRKSLRADDFLDLMESLGVDVTFTIRDSGKNVNTHIIGAGRRVKAVVNHIPYDTRNADALANSFYADGKNKFTGGKALELYIDEEGRYFFAEYSEFEGIKDVITPVTGEVAASFIEKYGTELHKEPTAE